jgi:iron complex transport system ATP-binding protein
MSDRVAPDVDDRRDGDADRVRDASDDSADSADPALSGIDLAVGYPSTEEPVVEADRVVLPRGEVTALVGPNGSGKSTLLRAFADELEPERGVAYLDGRDVQDYDAGDLARRLGVLAQENDPPAGITVEDLVFHGRYPHQGFFDRPDETDVAAVERAMARAGVTHLADSEVGELSGGQKQLAWLAMALAQETDVLLLDEPTNHLDLRHQLRVLDVIRELNDDDDVTLGVVLHDLEHAVRVADNLVAMRDGAPYDWGPPANVLTEALLADVFGVAATVDHGGDAPRVHARRALDDGDRPNETHEG